MYDQGYPPMNGYPDDGQYDQYLQYQQIQPQSPYPPQGGGWYPPMSGAEKPAAAPKKKRKDASGRSTGNRPVNRGEPGGRGRGSRRRRKSFKWQLLKFFLIVALLAGLAAGGYIFKVRADIRPYSNVFLDNIIVDGINLGGMTWEQGRDAVWAQARDKQTGWYVRLKTPTGDAKYITAETLGISFDPSAALREAWAIGHDASEANRRTVFEKWDEIEKMKSSSAEFFSAEQSADTSIIDSILTSAEQAAYIPPQDASIIGYDPNNTRAPFSFYEGYDGQRLDTASAKEQILHMVRTFQAGEITLEPEPIYRSVTKEQLQKTVSLRARVVTPIDLSSTIERINNIRVAFSKINGMTLNHEKRFSFNSVVGKRTLKNGFFEAPEYAYGELVTGVGGGVCQASTTVYLAAVEAGMTILSRTPHSNPVSYTDEGKDATVSDTKGREIDFSFRNDSGDKVHILAHVIADPSSKKRLLCEVLIYGLDLGNVRYALEAEIVQRLPKPGPEDREIVQDTKATYVTFTDEEKVVIKAREGCVVDSYICTYVDGVLTERKQVDRDTYPNRREKVYVGVTPRW